MEARYIQQVGTRAYLRVYWGTFDSTNGTGDCPNCCGMGNAGYHNTKVHLIDSNIIDDWDLGGKVEDYSEDMWPAYCSHCGAKAPEDAKRQVFRERLYNTETGRPEPGDLFWADWYPETMFWDNHKGPHLMAVLPNKDIWCIDSRASNCSMPNDRTHRCWVRTGELPNITVGKGGHTCQAGAGSIISGNYHGFLTDGKFTGV